MEDIRGQQLAYNTHLDTIRADHERALALEIEKQNLQNQTNLGIKTFVDSNDFLIGLF